MADNRKPSWKGVMAEKIEGMIRRGESFTTSDLTKGFDGLFKQDHEGVASTPNTMVHFILTNKKFRTKLYKARMTTPPYRTHRKVGATKRGEDIIYTRCDATVPKGYVLVPIDMTDKVKLANYIQERKGIPPVVKVKHTEPAKPEPKEIDYKSIATKLMSINRAQAELIEEFQSALFDLMQ